ncbi:CRISPR-associated helicase Cas3' [Glutamicibacter sp. NPDC087344]|uniref:CRISPR-associated helicase Cas3' n=1 Tax=Glutamicibacter sp. NPDC087344 TaxID=3363994 RepID=UPI0038012B04
MHSVVRPELWAKTNRPDNPAEMLFLPLYLHGLDSAAAVKLIFEHSSPNIRALLTDGMGLTYGELSNVTRFLAASHDVGKAAPFFQQKVPSLYVKVEEHGYPASDRSGDLDILPHSVHGMAIISRWLQENYGYSQLNAGSVSVVSGGHHGRFPEMGTLNVLRRNPGKVEWIESQDELLNAWAFATEASPALKKLSPTGIPPQCQSLLTGLVILADWAASNSSIFSLRSHDSAPDQFARLQEAKNALGLPETWTFGAPTRHPSSYYKSRFELPENAELSLMQETFYRVASSATSPELYILEAPTGSGKTEMALAAAEQLAANLGLDGVAFALPTMATTDAMLPRILGWVDAATADGQGTPTITLGHSKARFNERYSALPKQLLNSSIIYDEDTAAGSPTFLVHHFFSDRKRVFQPNISVVTIDQVLMAALNTKHYVLRHLGLASKVVIIDEVHAADAYMFTFLHRVLEWLASYGVPVILMSATLPVQQRRDLAKAYYSRIAPEKIKGKRSIVVDKMIADMIPAQLGYPCVTQVSSSGISMTHCALESAAVPVQSIRVPDNVADLWEMLAPRIENGGIVGVICNTVGRAQETFDFLQSKLPQETVLAHSRFVTADRLRIEKQILDMLGPEHSGASRPERQIIVGTSVLEQSLDIDFDLLISDLAPMDLLLQRVGRLHRHRRSNRLGTFDKPELWIRGVESWDRPHSTIIKSVSAIYDEYPLLNTLAVLEQRSAWDIAIQHPHQAAELVQEAYSPDLKYPSSWQKNHDEQAKLAADQRAKKASIASTGLIPPPKSSVDLFVDKATETIRSADPKTRNLSTAAREEAQAVTRVRDIEDSFEVLLMTRDKETISGLPWQDDLQLSLTEIARIDDFGLARRILLNSVRLPMNFSSDFKTLEETLNQLEAQGLEVWQENPLLKGQLVLFLSKDCQTTLANHHIKYDRTLGLIVTPPTKGATHD